MDDEKDTKEIDSPREEDNFLPADTVNLANVSDNSFQLHPSMTPVPPAFSSNIHEDNQQKNYAKKNKKLLGPKHFTTVIIILVAAVIILGGVLFAVNYKVTFKDSNGSFSIKVTDKDVDATLSDQSDSGVDSGLDSNTDQNSNNSGNSDAKTGGHQWNGSTLDLTQPGEDKPRMNFKQIYQKYSASVVTITSAVTSGNVNSNSEIHASGIVMTGDGYIITTCRAVMGAETIGVEVDNKQYPASIIGMDYATDLAVIKIDVNGLTAAEFGSSDNAVTGDMVAVVGNPVNGTANLFNGIISAVNNGFSYKGYDMKVIQVYMNLGSGATGSPLINEHGQVIGIIDMSMTEDYPEADSISFAITMSEAKPVIDQLLKFGYIQGRPASGIAVTNISPTAAAYYGLPDGVAVTAVQVDSTAEKAGILRGDVIYEANDIAISSSDDLYKVINGMSSGDDLTLGIFRNGKTGYVTFKLMEAYAPYKN